MAGLLSATGNKSISNQAITSFIANAKGDNNAIYQAALANGVSAQQIATAMGGKQGFTVPAINQYQADRNATINVGAASIPASVTSTPFQGPVKSYSQPAAASAAAPNYNVLFGEGNPSITDQQIQGFINREGVTDQQILDEAVRLGVSNSQITKAMQGNAAFTPSNVTQYLQSRNIFNPNQATEDKKGLLSDQQDFRDLYNIPRQEPINLGQYNPSYASAAIANQDPTLGTVSGQLNKILNSSSPLMQQAATFGDQQANSRGLLNSSIGIGAAQNEMIRAGLPIASADAQSNNQFALANQQTRQQANLFNSDIARQYDLTKLGITKDMAVNAENIARDYGLAQLDTESKIMIANINAASKSSTDAAGLNDRLLSSINDINSRDISQQAKDDQIRVMVNATDSAISMLGAFDAAGAALGGAKAGNRQPIVSGGGSSVAPNTTAAGQTNPTTGLSGPVITSSGYVLSGSELANAKTLGVDLTRVVTNQEIEDIRKSNGAIDIDRILGRFERAYVPGTKDGSSFIMLHPK